MISSLSRRSILVFFVMASVLSIFSVLIFTSSKTYASNRVVTVSVNDNNHIPETATHRMNVMCNSYDVGFGAYITDITGPDSSGAISYNTKVIYKRCNATNTRAYAIVGNRGHCPLVGRYGGNESGRAFDCVKYVGNPRYTPDGTGLNCDNPTGSNAACTYSGFNNIAVNSLQPPDSAISSKTNRINYSIPTSTWQQPSGSIDIGRESALCQYYKIKLPRKPWAEGGAIRGCQGLFVSVSWRERVYDLTPNISIGIDKFTGEANIPLSANISTRPADDPVGENHNWFVTKAVFSSPIDTNAVALSDREPCTFFNGKSPGSQIGVCQEAIGGGKVYPGESSWHGTRPTDSIPFGSYICYMTSIRNPTSRADDDTKWRHSDIKCAQSVAKPKLQVHGGDLRVASSSGCNPADKKGFINTSMSRIDGRYYGSWSEFASFSQCTDTNFTTGAKFEGGQPSFGSIVPYHELTFANDGSYGNYSTDYNIVRGVQPITDCPASVPTDHRYNSFGDFKAAVNAGNVAGSHCVGNSGSDLNIDSNVVLKSDPGSVKQIPQVILIGRSINIRDTVSRLDAWLIASNDLNTCVNSSNNRNTHLKSSVCNNQLVINGPVYTNKLYPDRTYGSRDDDDKSKAGEVFNLPASTSIWLYNQSKTSGAIDTVSLKELPPRY
jgi:hypothetical protein